MTLAWHSADSYCASIKTPIHMLQHLLLMTWLLPPAGGRSLECRLFAQFRYQRRSPSITLHRGCSDQVEQGRGINATRDQQNPELETPESPRLQRKISAMTLSISIVELDDVVSRRTTAVFNGDKHVARTGRNLSETSHSKARSRILNSLQQSVLTYRS